MTASSITFEDGILLVDTAFSHIQFRWQPMPLAEEKRRRGNSRWTECWPTFPVIQPGESCIHEAFAEFCGTIPAEQREIAAQFESHQWPLLCAMGRHSEVLELARINPVLAYAFCNSSELRGTKEPVAAFQIQTHRHDRQKEIAEWLGFPGTKSVVRVFTKLVPEAVNPSVLRRLKAVLAANPGMLKRLAHCSSINGAVLGFILAPRLYDLATPALLRELESRVEEQAYGETADQLAHALELLDHIRCADMPQPFRSVKKVNDFIFAADQRYFEHQRMLAELEERKKQEKKESTRRKRAETRAARRHAEQRAERREAAVVATPPRLSASAIALMNTNWPPPPIAGTADIVPITSYDMLREEARSQNNCCANYGDSVLNEKCYLYKLLKPQRCTVCIVPRSEHIWRLSEIKEHGNAATTDNSRWAVRTWLDQFTMKSITES